MKIHDIHLISAGVASIGLLALPTALHTHMAAISIANAALRIGIAILSYSYARQARLSPWWGAGGLLFPFVAPFALVYVVKRKSASASRDSGTRPGGEALPSAQQAVIKTATNETTGSARSVKQAPAHTGGAPVPATRQYRSDTWNFSITYPADWKIIWENEPAGSWTIPIAVAGGETAGGRPCFMINARREKILLGNDNLVVNQLLADSSFLTMPRTPLEYIELNKKTLARDFGGYQFISAEETRLADTPTARMLYSYSGNRGRIKEESVTVFGNDITFQIICEAPADRYAHFQPVFNRMLASFTTAKEPSSQQVSQAAVSGEDFIRAAETGGKPGMKLWWAYLHKYGKIEVKEWYPNNTYLNEARTSPYVKRFLERPFEAASHEAAQEVAKKLLAEPA